MSEPLELFTPTEPATAEPDTNLADEILAYRKYLEAGYDENPDAELYIFTQWKDAKK